MIEIRHRTTKEDPPFNTILFLDYNKLTAHWIHEFEIITPKIRFKAHKDNKNFIKVLEFEE